MTEYLFDIPSVLLQGDQHPTQPMPDGARLVDSMVRVYATNEYLCIDRRVVLRVQLQAARAVQEALGVAESTAAQKVSLARKLGLLPPTTPGKARA